MLGDGPVVALVAPHILQAAKHVLEIVDATDGEPDRGGDSRDQDQPDVELPECGPGGIRHLVGQVIDRSHHEDHRPEDTPAGDDQVHHSVPEGEVRPHPNHRTPTAHRYRGDGGGIICDGVGSAIEELVHVAGFVAAEQRKGHISDGGAQHGDQPEPLGVEREFHPEPPLPVPRKKEPREGGDHPDEQGRVGAFGGAPLPVEAADDDGARPAQPDGSGEGEVHQDRAVLGEEQAEEEDEDRDPEDGSAKQAHVLVLAQAGLAEGEDHVLHEDAAPGVQIGVVGADEGGQHHRGKRAEDADGQDLAEHDGGGELLLEGFVADAIQDGLDPRGRFRVLGMVHHGKCAHGNDEDEQALGHVAPGAEDPSHAGFVGIPGRRVVALIPLPGHEAIEDAKCLNQVKPDIEIGRLSGMEWMNHRFTGRAGLEGLDDGVPGELDHEDGHDHAEQQVKEGTLDKVGHDDRDLSAQEREHQGHAQQDEHDAGKHQIHLQEAQADHVTLESAELHEEAGAHRGKDSEIDGAGDEDQQAGKHAEVPAVSLFQELRQGERAGLPVAVLHPAGHGHRDGHHKQDQPPPGEGEAPFIVGLEQGHDGDRTHTGNALRHAQDVSTRTAVGGQEIRHRS